MNNSVIELVAAVCILTTGLSHSLYPGEWAALFESWTKQGLSGAFVNGMLHAGVGGFIVATHPVFVGWSSVLTYWAVLVLAKGLLYIAIPSVGLRSMRRVTVKHSSPLRWAGSLMLALGFALLLITFFRYSF